MERGKTESIPLPAAPAREPAKVRYEPPQVEWEEEFLPMSACSDPLNPQPGC
jgi:hypothetical protein